MFVVQLADISIGISPIYSSTQSYFADYIVDCDPEFTITVSAEELIQERKVAAAQTAKDISSSCSYTGQYLEQHLILRKIACRIPAYGAMFIHGSAVMVDGKSYLFTAPSGTGKSTHSRMWCELLGKRVKIINDDKPFVRFIDGQFFVYGTPWRGKHNLGMNISAPLAGICILSQSADNRIQKCTPDMALNSMLQQTFKPVEEKDILCSLTLLEELLNRVPIYRLSCNMDISAAELSYRTLTK